MPFCFYCDDKITAYDSFLCIDTNIFQLYSGHIIMQRQNVLPKMFSDLSTAQEECIFERTTCTGIIFSRWFYYIVSGTEVFKSTNAADLLYVKTGKLMKASNLYILLKSAQRISLLFDGQTIRDPRKSTMRYPGHFNC